MDIIIRFFVSLLMIAFMYGCEADERICKEGGKTELVDESLGDMVAGELERNGVPFKRIDKRTFCYELSFYPQVTKAVIAARSIEHPVGRIDVVRSIESEVKKALDDAGIRYSSSVRGDNLVLIVAPDNLERANDLIEVILEERY